MIKKSIKGTFLLLISLLFSCSTLDLKKQEIINKNKTINNNIPEINGYKDYDKILLVDSFS